MRAEQTKKGMIIIFAIIFMFLCFLAGGTYFAIITNECKLVDKEINSIKSFYLAEAGIRYGLWKIKQANP